MSREHGNKVGTSSAQRSLTERVLRSLGRELPTAAKASASASDELAKLGFDLTTISGAKIAKTTLSSEVYKNRFSPPLYDAMMKLVDAAIEKNAKAAKRKSFGTNADGSAIGAEPGAIRALGLPQAAIPVAAHNMSLEPQSAFSDDEKKQIEADPVSPTAAAIKMNRSRKSSR
jgi:hypothetical protein